MILFLFLECFWRSKMSNIFKYPAVLLKQTDGSPPIVLFGAPCTEIVSWAGIPQKQKFSDGSTGETVGFQREKNIKRVNEIKKFFENSRNVVQNPILCSSRLESAENIKFTPRTDNSISPCIFGDIEISAPDLKNSSFLSLFSLLKEQLEKRVPDLKNQEIDQDLLEHLKNVAKQAGHILDKDSEELSDEESIDDDGGDEDNSYGNHAIDPTSALFEETHIQNFWQEVAARLSILQQGVDENLIGDKFLGFDKEALASYVYPVVVVDGQHRLLGAFEHATAAVNNDQNRENIQKEILSGKSAEEIKKDIIEKSARWLPISLLLSDDPAEQVFQFVVVNQKATPIAKALLGTIVSTTLSQEELDRVASRLSDAGIKLEESRAISRLIQNPDSPFYLKVQRGIEKEQSELLEWSVFGQIVSIFRSLKGGKPYNSSIDFSDFWRKKYLNQSDLVKDYQSKGYNTTFEYWSSIEGPWRIFFTEFWKAVRDKLADTTHKNSHNYWGNPRTSNLFNKVTLTILASDFFQYLFETQKTVNNFDEISTLVDDWLADVDKKYFDQDWKLSNIKKDSPSTKKQWAKLWNVYRKTPDKLPLPSVDKFSQKYQE